jgi:predicted DNA-binding transcriptional regulator AlpA
MPQVIVATPSLVNQNVHEVINMEKLLTVKDLAAFFQTSEASIRNAIYKKRWDRIPPPIPAGSRRYWSQDQVANWVEKKIELAYKQAFIGPTSKKIGRPTKGESIIQRNTPDLL